MFSIELTIKSNGIDVPLDKLIDNVVSRIAEALKAQVPPPVSAVSRQDPPLPDRLREASGIRETAKLLAVAEANIRKCIYTGRIPIFRVGSRVLISRKTIEKILVEGVEGACTLGSSLNFQFSPIGKDQN